MPRNLTLFVLGFLAITAASADAGRPAQKPSASVNGRVVVHGVVVTSARSNARVTSGNGAKLRAKVVMKRADDAVRLDFLTEKPGVARFIPGLRWKREARMSGTLAAHDADRVLVRFDNLPANRADAQRAVVGRAAVRWMTGSFSLTRTPEGTASMSLERNLVIDTTFGPMNLDVLHRGDDVSVK